MERTNQTERKAGLAFLGIGVVSLAAMVFLVSSSIGDEEFFYVTKTVRGITTYEYSPGFVIGMLAVWFLASALFIGVGIHIIRKDSPRRYRSRRNSVCSDNEAQEGRGISTGLTFLAIGIFSAMIPTYFICTEGGNDDFFYVTSTVNGVTTTEYNPWGTIGVLIFCYLFALTFIILGIYMAKNKKLAIQISVGGSFETDSDSPSLIRAENPRQAKLLPKIFISIGLLILLIGGGLLIWDRVSLQSLIKTEAIVTEKHHVSPSRQRSSSTGSTYYAKLEYEIEGKYYKSQITTSMFFHDSQVTVYCDPQNPIKCRTNDEYLIWYLILFPVGIGFAGIGIFIYHRMKKGMVQIE